MDTGHGGTPADELPREFKIECDEGGRPDLVLIDYGSRRACHRVGLGFRADFAATDGKRWRISAEPIITADPEIERVKLANQRYYQDGAGGTGQPVDERTVGQIGAELEREALGDGKRHVRGSSSCVCPMCLSR
jgi:hypothetical protein